MQKPQTLSSWGFLTTPTGRQTLWRFSSGVSGYRFRVATLAILAPVRSVFSVLGLALGRSFSTLEDVLLIPTTEAVNACSAVKVS